MIKKKKEAGETGFRKMVDWRIWEGREEVAVKVRKGE